MEALILSCGTGGGHNAAGKALEEEWKKRGYQVTFLNPYTLKSERMAKVIDYLYVDIVQKTPLLFGIIYQIGNLYRKLPVKSPVYYINGKMTGLLYRYLEEKKPDVILMPHLYPAEIPLIHITPIPGCETLNMQYFQEKGMSVAMPVIEERLCACCDRLLAEDGGRQKERQRRHISKRAARKIYDFVEEKVRKGQTGR